MKTEGTIVDEQTAKKQTEEALAELLSMDNDSHNMTFHKILVEKDGQMVEMEVAIDGIDLLDDFDDEDLTEEGERSLGMIDENHDTTSEEAPVKTDGNRMPKGQVKIVTKQKYDPTTDSYEEYKDYEITCPFTGSTEVYQINSNIFASYETNQRFRVYFHEDDSE